MAVASFPAAATAQTVLSDFSDIAAQNETFTTSWGAPNQYTQNAGFITIEPVEAGNPQGDGTLLVRMDLDLTVHTSIDVRAREDSGNQVGVFSIVFFNPQGPPDSQGTSVGYTFSTADFASGFTTRSIDLSAPPDFTVGEAPFDPSAVNYWQIEADPINGSTSDFRMAFDQLQLTTVPEPSTWAMLMIGGALFLWRRLKTV